MSAAAAKPAAWVRAAALAAIWTGSVSGKPAFLVAARSRAGWRAPAPDPGPGTVPQAVNRASVRKLGGVTAVSRGLSGSTASPPFWLFWSLRPSNVLIAMSPGAGEEYQRFRAGRRRCFHATTGSRAVVKDPYALLGIKRHASTADIKKAYYAAAKKYHPDANRDKDAHENFVRVQEAYDTLSDERRRAAFDRSGSGATGNFSSPSEGFAGKGYGAYSNANDYSDFDEMMNEEDLYNVHDQRGGGRQRSSRGKDVYINHQVDFMDAIHGKTVTVDVPRTLMCTTCSGYGYRFGARRKACRKCSGRGSVRRSHGANLKKMPCTKCDGTGWYVSRQDKCGVCNGQREVTEMGKLEVKIKPGTADGNVITVLRQGSRGTGRNGKAGDLYVKIEVRPSQVFRREGNDIHISTEVPLFTAVLGGYVRVPTVDGEVEMKVRPGSQSGHVAVLRGRGIMMSCKTHSGRGQQYVTINVVLPAKLTSKQRELFELLAAEEREHGSASASRHRSPADASSSHGSASFQSAKRVPEADGDMFRSTFEKAPSPQSSPKPDPSQERGVHGNDYRKAQPEQ